MDIQKVPYTRIITPAPRRPVENSVPLFGSYSGMFHTFDIRGVKKPFGDLPFPSFITDIRITDTLRLLFSDENLIGEIEFLRRLLCYYGNNAVEPANKPAACVPAAFAAGVCASA